MTGREKEIVRHLSEDDLDRLLTQTDDEKMSKRLTFIKRLHKGATLEDAADDVGMSQSTSSRWVTLWNKGGLGLLTPSFGGSRPPKLDDEQRERLLDLLEQGEPWKKQEIQHLLNEEFDVGFHPNYLPRLLDDLGLSFRSSCSRSGTRELSLTRTESRKKGQHSVETRQNMRENRVQNSVATDPSGGQSGSQVQAGLYAPSSAW
jgi:transposase